MTTSRRVASGTIWVFGTQLATMLFQFAYAGFTGRLVGPTAFGIYAIAVAATGLLSVVFNVGIAKSVMRTADLSVASLRAVCSYSWVLGSMSAAVLLIGSPLWVSLWGVDQDAAEAVQWLALSAFVSPYLGVVLAYARRNSQFKLIAMSQLCASIVGILAGCVLVYFYRTPSALVANLVVTQAVLLAYLYTKFHSACTPGRFVPDVKEHVYFSAKIVGSSVLHFLQTNLFRFGVSRYLGATALGYWNRADVLSTAPFLTLEAALIQAIFPEFRHGVPGAAGTRSIWSAMLVMVLWITLPLALAGAVVLPFLVPLLLGPGWEQVEVLLPYLLLAAGIQPVASVLNVALEAVARFKLVYISQIAPTFVQLLFIMAIMFEPSWTYAIVGVVVTPCVKHVVQIVLAHKHRLLNGSEIVRGYLSMLFLLVPLVAIGMTSSAALALQGRMAAIVAGILVFEVLVLAVAIFLFYQKLPPYKIGKKYRLF